MQEAEIKILLSLPDRSGYSTQGYRWVLGQGIDLFLMVQGGRRGPGLGTERISEDFLPRNGRKKKVIFFLRSLGVSD